MLQRLRVRVQGRGEYGRGLCWQRFPMRNPRVRVNHWRRHGGGWPERWRLRSSARAKSELFGPISARDGGIICEGKRAGMDAARRSQMVVGDGETPPELTLSNAQSHPEMAPCLALLQVIWPSNFWLQNQVVGATVPPTVHSSHAIIYVRVLCVSVIW